MDQALQAQTLCLILDLTLRAHNLLKALLTFMVLPTAHLLFLGLPPSPEIGAYSCIDLRRPLQMYINISASAVRCHYRFSGDIHVTMIFRFHLDC
jgi:hypothetical protein